MSLELTDDASTVHRRTAAFDPVYGARGHCGRFHLSRKNRDTDRAGHCWPVTCRPRCGPIQVGVHQRGARGGSTTSVPQPRPL